ncbi:MAG: ATP-binding protein [Anaerolineales bacterium]|jgi:serine/threonine-protein kinase RsbW
MRKSTFEANFHNLDDIRDFVGEAARQLGFSEKEIYSIQLAADEASTNIIEHAYAGIDNGTIEIDCSIADDELKIVMRDNGRAFDPSSVPEPNVKADLSERKIGGLGMYLMRKLMDEVFYESLPEGWNILTMIKRKGAAG